LNKQYKNPVLVFNCHYNGLSIIQELSKHGIKCYALDYKRSIGTFSRYATFIKVPNPQKDEKKFIEKLKEICCSMKEKPVLFPTNDEWASAISKYKKELESISIPCVSDWNAVKLLLNKDEFYKWGEEKKHPVPRTWKLNEFNKISTENYPLLAKPKFRRISSDKESKFDSRELDKIRFKILTSPQKAEEYINNNQKYSNHIILQEYVKGLSNQMYTVGVYANKNSKVLGLFTGRKVRGYPADSGDCIVGQVETVPKFIVELSKDIVREINYSGIAEIEFKRDEDSGDFYLIEINPRSWSWIGITAHCGVNLSLIAYLDLTGQQVDYKQSLISTGSVKYVKIISDFINCLFRYKNDQPEWKVNFKEWKDSLKADKLVIAEFNRFDWPVLIYLIISLIYGNIKNLFKVKS